MRTLILISLAFLTSCANVTTMKVRQYKDGSWSVDSGKDVKADLIVVKRGNESIELHGYSSMANTDAINAEGNREVAVTNAVSAAVLQAIQAGISAATKP